MTLKLGGLKEEDCVEKPGRLRYDAAAGRLWVPTTSKPALTASGSRLWEVPDHDAACALARQSEDNCIENIITWRYAKLFST